MTGSESAAVVDLGALSLRFGRVDRATFHEDGLTPESDTDHTVMLGLVACAFAAKHTNLDVGLVAQFALVHDVVEVYAGDTNTLRALTEEGKAHKEAREAAALQRIRVEFDPALPWLPDTITTYEERSLPEARFVKAMDKLLPKITHLLNDCRTPIDNGMDVAELAERYAAQLEEILAYAADFPALLDLRAELVDLVLEQFAGTASTRARTRGA